MTTPHSIVDTDTLMLDSYPRTNFLSLPTELRLQIYTHLFTNRSLRANAFHYPLDDDDKDTRQGHISLQPPSPLLNILLTCRRIHDEAIPQMYTLVRFHFERHSVEMVNWDLVAVLDAFPPLPIDSSQDLWDVAVSSGGLISSTSPHGRLSTHTLVTSLSYAGNSSLFIRGVTSRFASLRILEFDLGWDHIGIDQTNFDRAMKWVIRHREWRAAIKDALEQRFPEGMVGAIWELQMQRQKDCEGSHGDADGNEAGEIIPARRFRVLLHWRLAYRFVEFVGECDLDEWVLRVRDPDRTSENVYDIRQDPMYCEMS